MPATSQFGGDPHEATGHHRVFDGMVAIGHRTVGQPLGAPQRDDVGVAGMGVLQRIHPAATGARGLLGVAEHKCERGDRQQDSHRSPPGRPTPGVATHRTTDDATGAGDGGVGRSRRRRDHAAPSPREILHDAQGLRPEEQTGATRTPGPTRRHGVGKRGRLAAPSCLGTAAAAGRWRRSARAAVPTRRLAEPSTVGGALVVGGTVVGGALVVGGAVVSGRWSSA